MNPKTCKLEPRERTAGITPAGKAHQLPSPKISPVLVNHRRPRATALPRSARPQKPGLNRKAFQRRQALPTSPHPPREAISMREDLGRPDAKYRRKSLRPGVPLAATRMSVRRVRQAGFNGGPPSRNQAQPKQPTRFWTTSDDD